ncbi:MAG: hypothetical protein KIH03_13505 [Paludibacteraceae bacterium]|nr:hypothetical protein [Paludibacteraceae bacterium]
MNRLRLFFATISSVICGSVMADSAPMYDMPGGAVMPISNNDIRLVSETIDFYLYEDNYDVEVNYDFYNEGKAQEIELGFPTVSSDAGYKDFETFVNGQSIKVVRKPGEWSFLKKKGEHNAVCSLDQNGNEIPYSQGIGSLPHYTINKEDGGEEKINGGDAFDVFRVTFKAGDTTKVKNTYNIAYENVGHDGDDFFWYILETGRYWKGKIDKVTVRIHTENYKKSRNYFVSSHKYDNYVREFKNIEPDFNLFYPLKNFARSMPEASSTLQSGKNNSYGVENLIDENPATAWVEGVNGYGEGETLKFCMTCDSDYDCWGEKISKIYVTNGYSKNEVSFKSNSRVKELEVYITEMIKRSVAEASKSPYFNIKDDQCQLDMVYADRYYYFVLDDTMKEQELDLDGVKEIVSMTFKIVSVYSGDKYKDTAVSGIRFY